MIEESDPDLSLKDIEFLKAVRDINTNPDDYPAASEGAKPANTTTLRNATSLTRQEIKHRLHEKSDIAGEEVGLIEIYDPPVTESGFGPKAVELTLRGDRLLEDALAKHGLGNYHPKDVATADRIAGLESRLDGLEDAIQELRQQMDDEVVFDGPEDSDDWEAMVRAHDLLFRALLGTSGSAYDDINVDEDEVAAEVLAKLQNASGDE
jgi:hypothetical protein